MGDFFRFCGLPRINENCSCNQRRTHPSLKVLKLVSDRNSVSAETIGIGIGFGAETFSAETEIAIH